MVVQTAFLLQHGRKTLDAGRQNISLVPLVLDNRQSLNNDDVQYL